VRGDRAHDRRAIPGYIDADREQHLGAHGNPHALDPTADGGRIGVAQRGVASPRLGADERVGLLPRNDPGWGDCWAGRGSAGCSQAAPPRARRNRLDRGFDVEVEHRAPLGPHRGQLGHRLFEVDDGLVVEAARVAVPVSMLGTTVCNTT